MAAACFSAERRSFHLAPQFRPKCDYVFHRLGQPLIDFRGAWDSAVKRASLKMTLAFHDLRRSGVRNLSRSGVPETVTMSITGHLIFTMLGEKSTTARAKAMRADGFRQNAAAAHSGGKIAGDARRELKRKLGSSVVSRENFLAGSRKKFPRN